ncbi:hypothetical protein ZYGR_0BA00430 [Zygosaccharomyces rouxii]|uniref:Uncharacterized protein n=1 Tax=Zygosaccharomyces rouxii TaxID=4956 RepID=A0A1Q3AK61_ZYGRO|nr:hypothetical protein ZYGR_0BA00430 [Zygosaccharomyces rouxii]
MARGRVRNSRTSPQRVALPVRPSTANSLDDCSLRQELSLVRSSSLASKIYLPKQTMLMAALLPIARVLYYWDEFFGNQHTMPLIFKFLVAFLVSVTSAAVAATAVWWPRQFKNKVEIDTKCSRMGLLFCVFGAQVGQSACQSLNQLWGRRLVTLMALTMTTVWEKLTQSWHRREVFFVGCFLCGAAIPTYLCISRSILLELFAGGLLNFVFFMYTVITLAGIILSRPTPIVASGYLLGLLLMVPNTYSTNSKTYEKYC